MQEEERVQALQSWGQLWRRFSSHKEGTRTTGSSPATLGLSCVATTGVPTAGAVQPNPVECHVVLHHTLGWLYL